MKISPIYFFLLLVSITLKAQDTSFVNKHHFANPVRNVFLGKDGIYVKTGSQLFKWENKNWVLKDLKFHKNYVFFEKDYFESDYLPSQYCFDANKMSKLIPQESLINATKISIENQLFVCVGGSLYEYSVSPNFTNTYKNISIRDIYLEKGLKIVSTYAGIFINDSVKAKQPDYASGSLCKIKNKYYLCSDKLYVFVPPNQFQLVDSTELITSGYYRKLVEMNNQVFSLNTKSINIFDTLRGLQPIHQGFEYQDLIKVADSLFFSTTSGKVFKYVKGKTSELVDLQNRVRGLYFFRNTLYISTDKGVFTIENDNPISLKKYADLLYALNLRIDANNNTWISTENGLFVIPDKSKEPIPFIPNIEFNRGALNLFEDKIYIGSINGMYEVDTYRALRDFIPQFLNREKDEKSKKNYFYLFILVVLIGVLIPSFFIYKKFQRKSIVTPNNEKKALNQENMELDIIEQDIMTVDGLAEYYQTNTVQLNRLFKKFDTTPGKFLKTVKMKLAKDLVKNGESMEKIVEKTGYTAQYIKKNLGLK